VYTYDAIGSYERVGYGCQGSGKELVQPVLDNQLKAASPLVLPPQVGRRMGGMGGVEVGCLRAAAVRGGRERLARVQLLLMLLPRTGRRRQAKDGGGLLRAAPSLMPSVAAAEGGGAGTMRPLQGSKMLPGFVARQSAAQPWPPPQCCAQLHPSSFSGRVTSSCSISSPAFPSQQWLSSLPLEQAVDLVKGAFVSAGERDIYTVRGSSACTRLCG
jgi:hypothetical protein